MPRSSLPTPIAEDLLAQRRVVHADRLRDLRQQARLRHAGQRVDLEHERLAGGARSADPGARDRCSRAHCTRRARTARRARSRRRGELGRHEVLSCRCACTSLRSRRTSSPAGPRPSRARGRRGCRRTPRCPRCSPRRSPGRGTARAAAIAPASCARSSTMLTPTELPSFAGLTTHGSGQVGERGRRRCRRPGRRAATGASAASARRCDSKIRLDITLSIASALARMPEPVHGMPQARAQALHRAVLAPRAVQRVPHDLRAGVLEQARAGSCRRFQSIATASHALLLERGEHAGAGVERDLALGGQAAHHDGDALARERMSRHGSLRSRRSLGSG